MAPIMLDNHQSLVQCYYALGELTTALELTRALVERAANDVEMHRFAVEIALRCGDHELAMQEAHQLVRLQPSHAETYCYKARVELARQDWPAAERTLRLGFHKAVDGAFALFELVEVLISDEEMPQAHARGGAGRMNWPRSSGIFRLARESAARDGRLSRMPWRLFARRLRWPRRMMPIKHGWEWCWTISANIRLPFVNSIMCWPAIPSDVWTLSNRGLSYLALGIPERALVDFSRGMDIDPEEAPLYFWSACAKLQMHELDEAIRDLTRAVDLSDDMLAWLEQEPMLDSLRHEPRFLALLRRAGREG